MLRVANRLLIEQCGQVGLEYMLATAAIAVVIAAGLIGAFEAIVRGVLPTLCNTVDPLGPGSCISF
jgi:hypothetical protein